MRKAKVAAIFMANAALTDVASPPPETACNVVLIRGGGGWLPLNSARAKNMAATFSIYDNLFDKFIDIKVYVSIILYKKRLALPAKRTASIPPPPVSCQPSVNHWLTRCSSISEIALTVKPVACKKVSEIIVTTEKINSKSNSKSKMFRDSLAKVQFHSNFYDLNAF